LHPRITRRQEKQIKNFILFLAIVCGGVSFLFFTAAKEAADGPNWASQVCKVAVTLCYNPRQLALAAVGLGALWLVVMFVSAIRD
jgi:hypothetical protein